MPGIGMLADCSDLDLSLLTVPSLLVRTDSVNVVERGHDPAAEPKCSAKVMAEPLVARLGKNSNSATNALKRPLPQHPDCLCKVS